MRWILAAVVGFCLLSCGMGDEPRRWDPARSRYIVQDKGTREMVLMFLGGRRTTEFYLLLVDRSAGVDGIRVTLHPDAWARFKVGDGYVGKI